MMILLTFGIETLLVAPDLSW